MKSILFADDNPQALEQLRSQLQFLGSEWTMRFASTSAQTLEMLEQTPSDVVVMDAMMPGTGTGTLLEQVVRAHPDTIRVVLSDPGDREAVLRLVGLAHQYLSKPCDPGQLRDTIGRALAMRELLTNRELQQLVSRMKTLPSLPALYTELMGEVRSSDPSMDRIGEIIARDMAMSAKILQLVNSAFFGLGYRVTHPTEAAIFLGIETVKSLVLSVQVFSQFNRYQSNVPEFSLEQLWQHCWNTGVRARRMARSDHFDAEATDHCFVGGLLHDVGRLVLVANLPAPFKEALRLAREKNLPSWEAEKQVLGSSHAEVGGYLLSLWNFPNPVVEAVALHHRPGDSLQQRISSTTIVHVANVLDHDLSSGAQVGAESKLDLEYLRAVGAESRLEEWWQAGMTVGPSDS